MYMHFTDLEGAVSIAATRVLWESSFITGVYAVRVGQGVYVPGVQRTAHGRATNRDWCVLFTSKAVPSYEYEEEVVWRAASIEIEPIMIAKAEDCIHLLQQADLEETGS